MALVRFEQSWKSATYRDLRGHVPDPCLLYVHLGRNHHLRQLNNKARHQSNIFKIE